MSQIELAVEAWQPFFAATAGVTAVLLGLVFVGLSIHLERQALQGPTRGLAIGSATYLVYALFTSLAMLIPQGVPYAQGAALFIIALMGMTSAYAGFADARRSTTPRVSRGFLIFEFGLPYFAIVLLLLAAIGCLASLEAAVWGAGAAVFVLVAIGTQSAWDLLFRFGGPPGSDDRDRAR